MVGSKLAVCAAVMLLVSSGVFAESVVTGKLTISRLRAIASAVETYAVDTDLYYPQAADMDELAAILSPKYIQNFPRDDEWGKPFAYAVSKDRMGYRLVSGGADGKIASASREVGSPVTKGSDDLILENGEMLTGE